MYVYSFRRYKEIEKATYQAVEELYEDISPACTASDNLGIYSTSVRVPTMAFYIIEQKERLFSALERHKERYDAVVSLCATLSSEDVRMIEDGYFNRNNYKEFALILKRMLPIQNKEKSFLEVYDVSEEIPVDVYDQYVEEIYERAIATGDNSELFEGYYDVSDEVDKEIFRLREVAAQGRGRKCRNV